MNGFVIGLVVALVLGVLVVIGLVVLELRALRRRAEELEHEVRGLGLEVGRQDQHLRALDGRAGVR